MYEHPTISVPNQSCINLSSVANTKPHLETQTDQLTAANIPTAMTSTDTTSAHATTTKSSEPPLGFKSRKGLVVDVALRVLLFATAFVAIIIMVTSKQTKLIQLFPGLAIPVVAKFNQSPGFM